MQLFHLCRSAIIKNEGEENDMAEWVAIMYIVKEA
jgi:hypothetical protein